MITKGEVTKILDDNKLEVRLFVFESPGINQEVRVKATICYQKGNINAYKQGDTVFVSFEDNDFGKPIILGSLYVDEDSDTEGTNFSNLSSIKIWDNAELPTTTAIGNVTGAEISTYNDRITDLESKNYNTIFNTDEQAVGTWVDNKVLYKKTIVHTATQTSNTAFSYYIDISNISFDTVWVDLNNSIQIGNQYILNEYCIPNQSDYWNTYIDKVAKKLYVRGYAPDTVSKHIITILYTKN